MSTFPNTYSELVRVNAPDLEAKGYEVWSGLTPEYADQITAMTHEPAILEYCPNDSGSRFTDHAATERWLAKQRGAFLLIKADDKSLAGYGWVGSETCAWIPEGQTTFALRMSQHHQGLGLATPFSASIITGARELYGAEHIWLETWQSNAGAVHIYGKLGFQQVHAELGDRPTADGQRLADTRLYMSLV
jgi:GNAT superfamily N-acetyltransferase